MEQILEKYSLQGNWVDLIFLLIVFYFIANNRGFIGAFFEGLGFLFSLFFSYKFYSFFGKLLVFNFSLSKGIANTFGFFIAWFLFEVIFSFIVRYILSFLSCIQKFEKHPINLSLGFVAAFIQASLFFLFIISLIFAFPIYGQIKNDILQSKSGPFFVNLSRSLEKGLKNIFGEAINETLNFITVKPESEESINLEFKMPEKQLFYDSQSEFLMINLVNQERIGRDFKALTVDEKLKEVARIYGREMIENGFFSHISAIDGSTPAERASRLGVSFVIIGENLAFAPDVYIAHQGLMNSPGHRKNILFKEYGRIGVGVVDGGIYGKMFVQMFAD